MASSDSNKRPPPPPRPDSAAMPPSSWAKRTGFRPKVSGETNATDSGQISALPPPELPQARPKPPNSNLDLETGRPQPAPDGEAAAAATAAKDRAKEEKEKERKEWEKELAPPVRKRNDSDGGKNLGANGQTAAVGEGSRRAVRNEEAVSAVGVG